MERFSREKYMKRIGQQEIDLFGIMKYVLQKWKIVLVLFVSFFFCGIVVLFFFEDKQDKQEEQTSVQSLTEEERARVNEARFFRDKLDNMMDYRTSSYYMNLDAYNCYITVLQYFIKDEMIGVNGYSVYREFVESGELASIIEKELSNEISGISDLISVVDNEVEINKEENSVRVSFADMGVLSVKILSEDEQTGRKLADDVKTAFEDYHKKVVKNMPEHKISLLSESGYYGRDKELCTDLKEFGTEVSRTKEELTALESQLSDKEKQTLELELGNIRTSMEIASQPGNSFLKQVVLLSIACLVLSVFCMICYYFLALRNMLKSGDEIVSIFGLPYMGEFSKEDHAKKMKLFQKDIEGICSELEQNRVFFCMMMDDKEVNELAEELKNSMRESDIELILGNDISADSNAMEEVQRCKNMVFVFETEKITYNAIDRVLQKCDSWGINVIGAIEYKK